MRLLLVLGVLRSYSQGFACRNDASPDIEFRPCESLLAVLPVGTRCITQIALNYAGWSRRFTRAQFARHIAGCPIHEVVHKNYHNSKHVPTGSRE